MIKAVVAWRGWAVCLVAAALVFQVSLAQAGHGDARAPKTGILLVAFGTTVPEARVSLENVDAEVKKAFPGVPVRWAYTSKIIRHKLAAWGEKHLSPSQALAAMADENFTHVAVQSLHTIPGEEFSFLQAQANAFSGMPKGMEKVAVGAPLLSVTEDVDAVCDALVANLPKERKANEAVVFMGHGTHHPGNIYYAALQYHLWKRDPNLFMGTVEGSPELDDVVAELEKRAIKTVYLMPFMSVAGDHACNDMAGPEEDSWKSVLEARGFKVGAVLRGTAEYDNIVNVWIGHLRAALDHLR